jgi:rhodanese-related sulfurtransferase
MRIPRSLVTGLAALLLLGAAGCGSDSRSTSTPTTAAAAVRSVDAATIAPQARAGKVLLVDVREQDEWTAGHAPGAIHVPLGTLQQRLDTLRRQADGRPVAFVCASGRRSAQAAELAATAGLPTVLDVTGGMGAWAAAGLALVPAGGTIL